MANKKIPYGFLQSNADPVDGKYLLGGDPWADNAFDTLLGTEGWRAVYNGMQVYVTSGSNTGNLYVFTGTSATETSVETQTNWEQIQTSGNTTGYQYIRDGSASDDIATQRDTVHFDGKFFNVSDDSTNEETDVTLVDTEVYLLNDIKAIQTQTSADDVIPSIDHRKEVTTNPSAGNTNSAAIWKQTYRTKNSLGTNRIFTQIEHGAENHDSTDEGGYINFELREDSAATLVNYIKLNADTERVEINRNIRLGGSFSSDLPSGDSIRYITVDSDGDWALTDSAGGGSDDGVGYDKISGFDSDGDAIDATKELEIAFASEFEIANGTDETLVGINNLSLTKTTTGDLPIVTSNITFENNDLKTNEEVTALIGTGRSQGTYGQGNGTTRPFINAQSAGLWFLTSQPTNGDDGTDSNLSASNPIDFADIQQIRVKGTTAYNIVKNGNTITVGETLYFYAYQLNAAADNHGYYQCVVSQNAGSFMVLNVTDVIKAVGDVGTVDLSDAWDDTRFNGSEVNPFEGAGVNGSDGNDHIFGRLAFVAEDPTYNDRTGRFDLSVPIGVNDDKDDVTKVAEFGELNKFLTAVEFDAQVDFDADVDFNSTSSFTGVSTFDGNSIFNSRVTYNNGAIQYNDTGADADPVSVEYYKNRSGGSSNGDQIALFEFRYNQTGGSKSSDSQTPSIEVLVPDVPTDDLDTSYSTRMLFTAPTSFFEEKLFSLGGVNAVNEPSGHPDAIHGAWAQEKFFIGGGESDAQTYVHWEFDGNVVSHYTTNANSSQWRYYIGSTGNGLHTTNQEHHYSTGENISYEELTRVNETSDGAHGYKIFHSVFNGDGSDNELSEVARIGKQNAYIASYTEIIVGGAIKNEGATSGTAISGVSVRDVIEYDFENQTYYRIFKSSAAADTLSNDEQIWQYTGTQTTFANIIADFSGNFILITQKDYE